jgi:hypothetical protein
LFQQSIEKQFNLNLLKINNEIIRKNKFLNLQKEKTFIQQKLFLLKEIMIKVVREIIIFVAELILSFFFSFQIFT